MNTVLSVAGLELPARLPGAPRPVPGGCVLPPGDVALLHPFPDGEVYRHGWTSWAPAGWRRLSEEPLRIRDNPERLLTADDAATDAPGRHRGSGVGAVGDGRGRTLLLGALGPGSPVVEADRFSLTGWSESPGPGWFLAAGDETAVFADYATQLAQHLGSRGGVAPRVWSTWYWSYEDIEEGAVRGLVEEIAASPIDVDVFQVDDGWERAVGDWSPNDRFSHGMADLAERIRSRGVRAGLWLAPLICVPGSTVAREHPDWLVRDAAGAPLVAGHNWGVGYHALDTTRPAVQDHLRAVIARAVDWGFTYLKLDFMNAGAVSGVRSGSEPREVAYRQALELLRSAAGEDVYLLGSGVPVLASLGLVDGMRVGPDVAPYWDNTERSGDPSGAGARNALCASINRAWLRGIVHTDPDAAYFRSRANLLDGRARAVLADLALVLGFRSTSDPVSQLAPDELRRLMDFLTAPGDVEQLGRYRYLVDGREVDFTAHLDPHGRTPDRLVVK